MQAVILAGGKGTRMGDLSKEIPKPMLELAGRNLLQHKIDRLPPEIDEVIIVVHHKKEVIMDFFGSSYGDRKITYVDQGEPKGTAHALFAAKPFITGEFISMMGDDIYPEQAIKEILKYPWAMTVYKTQSFPTTLDIRTDSAGYMHDAVIDDAGTLGEIMVDVCLYKLQPEFLNAPLIPVSTSKELGLPHTLFSFAKQHGAKIKVVTADWWHKVNSPSDLAVAGKHLV